MYKRTTYEARGAFFFFFLTVTDLCISFDLLSDADQPNLNMVNCTPETMRSETKQEQSCEDLEVDADLVAEYDETPLEEGDGRQCEPKTLHEGGGHLGESSMSQESLGAVSEDDSWTKVDKSDVVREQQEDNNEPIGIQGGHIQDLRSNLHEIEETKDTPCQQQPQQQLQSSVSAETESQQHPQAQDVAETKDEQPKQTAKPVEVDSYNQQPQAENVAVAKEQQQQTAKTVVVDSHDQQHLAENVAAAKEQQQQTAKTVAVDSHDQQPQAGKVAVAKERQQQQTAKPVEVDDQQHQLKNVAESESPQQQQSAKLVETDIQQQKHKTGKIDRTEVKQQPQQQSQTGKIAVSKVKLQRQTAKVVEPEVNHPLQEAKCVPQHKPVQASVSLTQNQYQKQELCQEQPKPQNQDQQQAIEPKSKKKLKNPLKKLNPMRKIRKHRKQKSKDSETESSVERTQEASKSPTSPDIVSPNVDDDDIDVAKVHFSQDAEASSSKDVASVSSSDILEESNSNGAQLEKDESHEATQESSSSRDGQLVTAGASSSSLQAKGQELKKSETKPTVHPKQPAPRLDTSRKIEVNYKPPVRNTLAPKNSPTEQFYDILMIHSLKGDDLKEADYIKKIGKRYGWKVISVEEFPAGMTKFEIFSTMLPRCTYTMLLLTSNFYDDVWCNHRYAACLTAAVENRTHQWSVIPIVYDESGYETPLELTTIAGLLREARYFRKNLRSTVSTARRKEREEEYGFPSEPSPPPSPSPPDSPLMEQKPYGAAAKPTIKVRELI